MTIGQLAKKTEVNIETVRYYERRGILPKPLRSESGYRQYPEETVTLIQFIKNAKELGFSLDEISNLLLLRADAHTCCSEVKELAEDKVAEIQRKIDTFKEMIIIFKELLRKCSRKKPDDNCPILEKLNGKKGVNSNKVT